MVLDHDGAQSRWCAIAQVWDHHWDHDGVPVTSSMAGDDISDVTSYFLNHDSKNFIFITENTHSIL